MNMAIISIIRRILDGAYAVWDEEEEELLLHFGCVRAAFVLRCGHSSACDLYSVSAYRTVSAAVNSAAALCVVPLATYRWRHCWFTCGPLCHLSHSSPLSLAVVIGRTIHSNHHSVPFSLSLSLCVLPIDLSHALSDDELVLPLHKLGRRSLQGWRTWAPHHWFGHLEHGRRKMLPVALKAFLRQLIIGHQRLSTSISTCQSWWQKWWDIYTTILVVNRVTKHEWASTAPSLIQMCETKSLQLRI